MYLEDESEELNRLLKIYRKYHRLYYKEQWDLEHSQEFNDLRNYLFDKTNLERFNIVINLPLINNRIIQRNKTYYSRLTKYILTEKAIFLTITFNSQTLKKTNKDTRKRYVKEFLNDECSGYIANIDFGKENGREHYHAVVVPKNVKIVYFKWKYGTINGKRIIVDKEKENDLINHRNRLAKYITKLGLHSVKDSTLNNKLIYSRNEKML